MTVYARDLAPRSSYYFNIRLQDHASELLIDEIDTLRTATRLTMARYPFRIDAITVLPSEIYAVWTLPDGDNDHAARWSMITSLFHRTILSWDMRQPGDRTISPPRLWQRGGDTRIIRTSQDFEQYCQTVHMAPVIAGYVRQPEHWTHSSLHRDVAIEFMGRHARPRVPMRLPWSARNRALRASG